MTNKKDSGLRGCLTDILVPLGIVTTLGLASLIPSDGCRMDFGKTSGESKPRPEQGVELPKIKPPKIEQVEKQEGYVDILVDLNQKVGDVRETLTATDLPDLLKGSALGFTSIKGIEHIDQDSTNINQYLRFTNRFGGGQNITRDEDPRTRTVIQGPNGNALYFADGDPIFDYELEFEGGRKFHVSEGGHLHGLFQKRLNILGEIFRVTHAWKNSVSNGLELTLVTGENIIQGDLVAKHVIEGKDYVVDIVSMNSTDGRVEYRVNEEETRLLNPGESYTLKDGTRFTHLDCMPPQAPNAHTAQFRFNSIEMRLIDDNIEDNEFGECPRPANELFANPQVRIRGRVLPDDKIEIQGIDYRVLSDGRAREIQLREGQNLREAMANPESLASTSLNISYQGQHKSGKHIVRVHEK